MIPFTASLSKAVDDTRRYLYPNPRTGKKPAIELQEIRTQGLPVAQQRMPHPLEEQRAILGLDATLQTEKEKHEKILRELNGRYYQDPLSPLRQAWDNLVQSVANRPELDAYMQTLESDESTGSMTAKSSINKYLLLELKRDTSEAIFKKILSIQKNESGAASLESSLREQRRVLQNRQQQLCGDYYQDPASLLDMAWKKYQLALEAFRPDADALLNEFLVLDEERKHTKAELYFLDQQLSLSPTPSNATLTSLLALQRQIEILEGSRVKEALLTGRVNWKETAAITHRHGLSHIASHLLT